MAIVDTPNGVLSLKVVYYGPPGAGKTTNLESIAPLVRGIESKRLTPRLVGDNRVVSLEIPAGSLGRLDGRSVVVHLETIQGEVSGAEGWFHILADADGIVFVANSAPQARSANFKALTAIRNKIEGRGRSAAAIPVVMQWNKRDLAEARPVADLEMELNDRCFPSTKATASRGTGVDETLIEILKRAIGAAHKNLGGPALAEAELEQTVTASIQRLRAASEAATINRFGATIERQSAAWPERETVFSEESTAEERPATRMMAALGRAMSALHDQNLSGLPRGLMAGLLAGCDRTRGSLLLHRQGSPGMEECEIVPAGSDPLNAPADLCRGSEPLFIGEVAGAEKLQGALVVPLVFGSRNYGGMIVYVAASERAPAAEEKLYWKAVASLTSVYLAWQADENRTEVSRPTAPRPSVAAEDFSAS